MKKPTLVDLPLSPISPDIQRVLDDLQEEHDKGELSCIAVAVVYRNGATGCVRSECPNSSLLIGAIEQMKHRALQCAEDEGT